MDSYKAQLCSCNFAYYKVMQTIKGIMYGMHSNGLIDESSQTAND